MADSNCAQLTLTPAVHVHAPQSSGHTAMSITHHCASLADTDTVSDQTHIHGSQCGAMAGAYPANQMGTEFRAAESGTNIHEPVLPTTSGEDGMVQTIPGFHRHAESVPDRAGTSDGTAVERMGSLGCPVAHGAAASNSTTGIGLAQAGQVPRAVVDAADQIQSGGVDIGAAQGPRMIGGRPSLPQHQYWSRHMDIKDPSFRPVAIITSHDTTAMHTEMRRLASWHGIEPTAVPDFDGIDYFTFSELTPPRGTNNGCEYRGLGRVRHNVGCAQSAAGTMAAAHSRVAPAMPCVGTLHRQPGECPRGGARAAVAGSPGTPPTAKHTGRD